jgi:hypothetical protein
LLLFTLLSCGIFKGSAQLGLLIFKGSTYEPDCLWWILQNVIIDYILWCLIGTNLQASHSLMLICNGYLVLQNNAIVSIIHLEDLVSDWKKIKILIIHFNCRSIRKKTESRTVFSSFSIVARNSGMN